ncbi:hypothetical protein INT43_003948 [Umbelopsis isabellina]|uniref:Uncharacterized protein n=1 Tax=Mortierella isabellina TaxID=91625 RepID=A0A8H7PUJ3_MORIS|nr:hypothetical protein INT43_003948 [Umbelopsis isabellina]
MAQFNFTPPPTPANTTGFDDIGTVPHPMRHVWRHRYSHSQSSAFHEQPPNTNQTAHDKSLDKLRHRRSTGMVIQKFDSTTSERTFLHTASPTGPDSYHSGLYSSNIDVSNTSRKHIQSNDLYNQLGYRHSVDNLRGNTLRKTQFANPSQYRSIQALEPEIGMPETRPKARPKPLDLTDSSRKRCLDQASNWTSSLTQDECLDAIADDEFSSIRDQITQITRELQEMQVEELQTQEKSRDDERKQRHKLMEISQRGRIQQGRRLSISGAYNLDTDDIAYPNGHHRGRSHGSFFSHRHNHSLGSASLASASTAVSSTTHPQYMYSSEQTRDHDLLTPSNAFSGQALNEEDDDEDDVADFENEDIYQSLPASPNMTTLLLTTNSLINSRMEEMARSVSPNDLDDRIWHQDFVSLMSRCIYQSEQLESLSTDLLRLERQMRELLFFRTSVEEQLEQKEYMYNNQLEHCHQVLSEQRQMIRDLDSMAVDVEKKLERKNKKTQQSISLSMLSEQQDEDDIAFSNILQMNKKEQLVAQLRWQVAKYIGGGVGTGVVLHAYDAPNAGHSVIISGTASTMESQFTEASIEKFKKDIIQASS